MKINKQIRYRVDLTKVELVPLVPNSTSIHKLKESRHQTGATLFTF